MYMLYIGYVRSAIERGLYYQYVDETEDCTSIKGKIDLKDYLISKIPNGQADKFRCTYSNFEFDNAVNRIIKYTCKQLMNIGVGVYMEVLADVVMLPGESFVRAIVLTWKTNFGTTKICFDVSMSVIAAVLSFVFAGSLAGIREGTVIAALLVGFIARLIGKKLAFLKDMIFPESVSAENENEAKEQTAGTYGKNVIAIGRQFGSGGHDIGKSLAEKLGYDFYDAEIIQITAGTTGYSTEFVKKNEEIMTNSLLYDLVNQMYLNTDRQDEAPKDKIFEAECQVIRDLAKKGNCVIVGRCADYVLRNSGNCLKVFFSAPLVSRIRRVAQRQNISEGEAKATVQKNEKLRADNYRYYTRRMWGAAGNFDLSLNTDLGEEYIENCIRSAMKL